MIDWALAKLPLSGQQESGDRHVVCPFDDGLLIGVVDGLGHGRDASHAAGLIVSTLEEHVREPLSRLMERCHERLKGTRGAAASLASLSKENSAMSWLGVGNVAGVLARADAAIRPAREYLLLRSGVLGGRLPKLRAATIRVLPGDTLVFATDGIKGTLSEAVDGRLAPQEIADRILAEHASGTDDALVLVARYVG